jgi:hypothetical protein
MGTQLRQWAIRFLAAVALPIMLTLGLGAAANAQPVRASHVTSSTEHASADHDWEVYGPYYYYDDCRYAQHEFGGPDSHCVIQYRYHHHYEYWVWYLWVPSCKCDSRHLKK